MLPEQSRRWQYVVFTELLPQVNLLILAESERISFPCSYNSLRMRTPKSMEKARKAFLPEHRQTELEMQNPSVLYRIVCPLSQGWYLRSWTRKQFSIPEKMLKISQVTVTKARNKLKILGSLSQTSSWVCECEFNSGQTKDVTLISTYISIFLLL